jgi:YD repeat-containing protein
LTIQSNATQDPTVVVSLLGTGETPPQLVAPVGPLSFGSIAATGQQVVTQTISLSNSGQLPLQIGQNGISLATGTQFKIAGITSSTQGAINLAADAATIAGSKAETWTVTLQFSPTVGAALTDSLLIASNDPVHPTTKIPLQGTGLGQPIIVCTGAGSVPGNLAVSFPPTLDDGAGGKLSTTTVQLTNIGTIPLIIAKNGVQVLGGTNFHVVSVTSSLGGTVNLAAGSAALAPASGETWTVGLSFDPLAIGTLTDTLSITSDDPVNPTLTVALSGQGVVPTVTAVYPSQAIHVSAGWPYHITWTGSYVPGTGTYSVYYDTGRNRSVGLVPIVMGLPQSQISYDWQVPTGLVGGTYAVYVTLQDGTVTAGSFTAGSLTVDPQASDRLLSAPVTAQASYTLSYEYNRQNYAATFALVPGDNALYPAVSGVVHEYHVTLVPTLVDSHSTAYDSLGNVTATTDADGQATQYTYDQESRVTQVTYPDGSTVAYSYDPAGNLLTMHDSTGWQIYGYDALDRLTSVTCSPTDNVNDLAALTIGYQYDADSNLTELDYPSGERVLYGYDDAGKLTSVTAKNQGQPDQVTTYAYDSTTGLLASDTLPNNVQALYTYDSNGNLVGILNQQTSTHNLILQYQYTLDAAGRQTLAVMTTPSGSTAQAYAYDAMDRLIQVTYSNTATIDPSDKVVQYTYDGNGNRLTETTYANGIAAGATQTLTYVYNTENQLLSITDQNGIVQDAYAYDWRGNEIEQVTPTATTIYTYNSQNLLTDFSDGTNVVQYSYDGAGRRVSQTVNGVMTRFIVEPSGLDYQTLEELTNVSAVSASFTYGLNRISGALPGQHDSTYYLLDALELLTKGDGAPKIQEPRPLLLGALRIGWRPCRQHRCESWFIYLRPVWSNTYRTNGNRV